MENNQFVRSYLMSEIFFEIQKGNFTASKINKVNNVNLTIKDQGEIVSLLGPSGIGKTTILRTIAGLQKLSKGKIKLREKTGKVAGLVLTETLNNYAQTGSEYTKILNQIIGILFKYHWEGLAILKNYYSFNFYLSHYLIT